MSCLICIYDIFFSNTYLLQLWLQTVIVISDLKSYEEIKTPVSLEFEIVVTAVIFNCSETRIKEPPC